MQDTTQGIHDYLVEGGSNSSPVLDVVTMSEAIQLTGHAENTVRFWCWQGQIDFRQAGRIYLINRASLMTRSQTELAKRAK